MALPLSTLSQTKTTSRRTVSRISQITRASFIMRWRDKNSFCQSFIRTSFQKRYSSVSRSIQSPQKCTTSPKGQHWPEGSVGAFACDLATDQAHTVVYGGGKRFRGHHLRPNNALHLTGPAYCGCPCYVGIKAGPAGERSRYPCTSYPWNREKANNALRPTLNLCVPQPGDSHLTPGGLSYLPDYNLRSGNVHVW